MIVKPQLAALPRSRRFISKYRGSHFLPPINDLDRAIRQATPEAMVGGNSIDRADVQLTIELICGFEIFGHYETWSQGYRVSDGEITVVSEWLDIAIARYGDEKAAKSGNQ